MIPAMMAGSPHPASDPAGWTIPARGRVRRGSGLVRHIGPRVSATAFMAVPDASHRDLLAAMQHHDEATAALAQMRMYSL